MAQCPNCDGGVIYPDCPTCRGTGQILSFDEDDQERLVTCPTCGGSTTVTQTCPVCHGTGEI
jgi:DnaJ-class molecular chaperone